MPENRHSPSRAVPASSLHWRTWNSIFSCCLHDHVMRCWLSTAPGRLWRFSHRIPKVTQGNPGQMKEASPTFRSPQGAPDPYPCVCVCVCVLPGKYFPACFHFLYGNKSFLVCYCDHVWTVSHFSHTRVQMSWFWPWLTPAEQGPSKQAQWRSWWTTWCLLCCLGTQPTFLSSFALTDFLPLSRCCTCFN